MQAGFRDFVWVEPGAAAGTVIVYRLVKRGDGASGPQSCSDSRSTGPEVPLDHYGYIPIIVRVKPPAAALKICLFLGSSRKDLLQFPESVRAEVGYALHEAQRGDEPYSVKALMGFGGRGVLELVENHDGDTYRAVYTVRYAGFIFVLHCFQKKSVKGIRTPKKDIEIIKTRLRMAEIASAARSTKGIKQMSNHEVYEGSGNVFADLELPDAEELHLKANLVSELRRQIESRSMKQTAAAARVGIAQADLSKLLRGGLRGYSVERLMRMLTAFDQDVEITIRPHAKAGEIGRITYHAASIEP